MQTLREKPGKLKSAAEFTAALGPYCPPKDFTRIATVGAEGSLGHIFMYKRDSCILEKGWQPPADFEESVCADSRVQGSTLGGDA